VRLDQRRGRPVQLHQWLAEQDLHRPTLGGIERPGQGDHHADRRVPRASQVSLATKYPFTLPRGYVDAAGGVHRDGIMRLATARDELEPLRDPRVEGPDDPRLTVLILARVVEKLGTLDQVTPHEIEGLFAADLAFLQDFYGVINFGNQQEYEELLAAQQASPPPIVPGSSRPAPADVPASTQAPAEGNDPSATARPATPRPRVEEIPRTGG